MFASSSSFTSLPPSIPPFDHLLSTEAAAVADLEHFIERVIQFQVENVYTQEQYDIILS